MPKINSDLTSFSDEEREELMAKIMKEYCIDIMNGVIDKTKEQGGEPYDTARALPALAFYIPLASAVVVQQFLDTDQQKGVTFLLNDMEKAFAEGMKVARKRNAKGWN